MTAKRRILIVEDNEDLAFGLRANLEVQGYAVELASNGEAALRLPSSQTIDLVVLDLMLPDISGIEVLRRLRRRNASIPVLILTAKGSEMDKVMGLRLGADDYVTKPFALMELLARIEALLRRSGASSESADPIIESGELRIDTRSRSVTLRGEEVRLTYKEYDLLMALIRRSGRVASRIELMKEVWGHSSAVVSRTVDTHIAELRRKIGDDPAKPKHIVTLRKAGYRWQDRPDA